MSAPLVPVTLAFLAGVLLEAPGFWAPLGFVCGAVSAACALQRRTNLRRGGVMVLMLWVCLGILRMALWRSHPDGHLESLPSDEPQNVCLHGLVRDDPVQLVAPREIVVRADSRGASAAPPTQPPISTGQACVVEILHAKTGNSWQPLRGRVRALFKSPRLPLSYGDEILAEGAWSRVPSAGNPGQYDWHEALARQRIHGLFRAGAASGLVILRRGQGNPILAAMFRLRHRWETLIRQTFTPKDAGLLLSLLLGQRVTLDERLRSAFVETGTIHLLVISGFNVGLVAGLLELLLRVIGLPWRIRLLLLAVSVGGYCLLTGLQPPVARATLMAWVVLGSYALDRVISWSNTLAVAALIIVWLNPTQLFDPGFQLSFGAVLSLLLFAGRWSAWLESRLGWLHPAWARRYVAISLSATSAIWVGLSPVLAWYFHLVSPVSMLANLLIAPLMSALVSLGTALLMAATIFDAAMRWGSGLLRFLLSATLQCVSWCQAIPGGHWFVGQPPTSFLIGYYLLMALSVLGARRGWRPHRLLLCWVAALTIWLWSTVMHNALESRWLRVDILDVGHGDSIVVRTPRGETLVVDTGSEEAGRYRLLPFLRFRGITRVDALVLTHPDADHIGGAIPLLQELRVKRLLTNGVRDDTMSALAVQQLALSRHVEEAVVASGMQLGQEADLAIEVLHPPRGLVPGTDPPSNDNSVVLKVTKGSVSVLLCGDIEEAGLPWLLRDGTSIRATVLKVPHHGSRLGEIGKRFFGMVEPRIAVLSVGRLHHLPAPETVRALTRPGTSLYSTRTDGAISVRTDGRRLEIRTWRGKKLTILTIAPE